MKIILSLIALFGISSAAVVDEFLETLAKEARVKNPSFKSFSIKRGEEIFTSKHIGKRGKEVSCVSCHGDDLNKASKNFFTAKEIEPLSPKINPKRFSEIKTIEKWLKRNFIDVYNREGTIQEKGDVVTYIINR
jgi:cytochrome c